MAVLSRDRRSGLWWRQIALALTEAGLWLGLVAGAAAAPSLEYAVKANYLYKFGPFVTWPSSAFAGPASAFNVCIVGEDPFGQALDDATRGQAVDGHPVTVRRMAAVANNPDCHVLYIGRAGPQKPAQVLQLMHGQPVLTVTDDGVDGGIVQFVLRDGKVRFGIDAGAAQASGLIISSKLMSLAVPVGKEGR
jgi:hypothetical protein